MIRSLVSRSWRCAIFICLHSGNIYKEGNGSDPANTVQFQSFCWVAGKVSQTTLPHSVPTYIHSAEAASTIGRKITSFSCDIKALRTQHGFPNELKHKNEWDTWIWYGIQQLHWKNKGTQKWSFDVQEHTNGASQWHSLALLLNSYFSFCYVKMDRMWMKMQYNKKDLSIAMQPEGWMDKLIQKWICKVLLKHTKGCHW